MRKILCVLLALASTQLAAQQIPMYGIEARSGETLSYQLDVKDGVVLDDLSWAWNSSVACFVEPRVDYFKGNHVLFRTEIPTYSTMIITLVPDDPAVNLSLYAYSGGRDAVPPKLSSCVSCEADFYQEQPSVNRPNPDHTRSVELRAVTRPYPVTIGLAGAEGVTEGSYTLQVSIVPRD